MRRRKTKSDRLGLTAIEIAPSGALVAVLERLLAGSGGQEGGVEETKDGNAPKSLQSASTALHDDISSHFDQLRSLLALIRAPVLLRFDTTARAQAQTTSRDGEPNQVQPPQDPWQTSAASSQLGYLVDLPFVVTCPCCGHGQTTWIKDNKVSVTLPFSVANYQYQPPVPVLVLPPHVAPPGPVPAPIPAERTVAPDTSTQVPTPDDSAPLATPVTGSATNVTPQQRAEVTTEYAQDQNQATVEEKENETQMDS